jgi:2TM domain
MSRIDQDSSGFSKIDQVRRQVHREAGFYRHAAIYALVIGGLWALNLYQVSALELSAKRWAYWAIWPTLGWGLGLLSHGAGVFLRQSWFGADWQERKINERLSREQNSGEK